MLDPFAGGGSIPLEALRLGCEAHALELNPVAYLILLCTLVYPQKYGQQVEIEEEVGGMAVKKKVNRLAHDVERWGKWVLEEARRVGREVGAAVMEVGMELLSIPEVRGNRPDRCYHCKRELLGTALSRAAELGMRHVAEGTILDDLGERRPGKKAVDELGVKSPLLEVRLTKSEIRRASRAMGLSTWDKPSYTCLATRFPMGMLSLIHI